MRRHKGNVASLRAYGLKKSIIKANRLLDKKPKWNDEKMLTEADVDAYIERLQEKLDTDPKVGQILLRWMELKKKYKSNDLNPLLDDVDDELPAPEVKKHTK